MNKSIVSKLFLGIFLIFFMGSVFADLGGIVVTTPETDDYVNGTEDINWTVATGCTGDQNVEIKWTKVSPNTSGVLVQDINCALGTYDWNTIPRTDGDDYKIVVTGRDGTGYTYTTGFFTIDNTLPTLVVTMDDNELNVSDTSLVTFTFSEIPDGFGDNYISEVNGVVSGFTVTGDPLIYTGLFTPTDNIEDASNIITVGAGWTDLAGNNPTDANTSPNYGIDTKEPTVVLTAVQTDPTNVQTIEMTVTFDENVTGFDQSDITLGNATLLDFEVDTNFTVYSFDINAISQGEVTVDIDANLAIDVYDNNNEAATQFSITYDTVLPTLDSIVLDSNVLNIANNFATVTFTFSEAVTDFNTDDVTVDANVVKSEFTDVNTQVYTVIITANDGVEDLTSTLVVGTSWTDIALNSPLAGLTSENYIIDRIEPTLEITIDDNALNIGDDANVTFTFSEVPLGFDSTDVAVGEGSIGAIFPTENPLVFTAVLTPVDNRENDETHLTVGAGNFTDATSNPSELAFVSPNYSVDTKEPTVTITSGQGDSGDFTNVSPINMTATFIEAVTGFTVEDIDVVNGTISDFNSDNAPIYTFNITPNDELEITVDINANLAIDDYNNNNEAATQFSITYDTTVPTLVITMDDNALNVGDTSLVTFTFNQAPAGFTTDDVTVQNGTKGDINSDNPLVQTMVFTPTAEIEDATNLINVAVTWTDAAGNAPATDSNSANYTIDTNAPDATDMPTVTVGEYINAAEYAACVIITIPLGTSNAVAGDWVHLHIENWDVNETLTLHSNEIIDLNADHISAGEYDFNICDPTLGIEGDKNISATIEDAARNNGATSDELVLFLDTVDPVVDAGDDYFTITSDSISRTAGVTEDGSGIATYLWAEMDEATGFVSFDDNSLETVAIDVTEGEYDTYFIELTVTDAAGNEGVDYLRYVYETMYGFEFLGQSGNGFSAEIEEGWFSEYRFEHMNIWDENLMTNEFLNSAAGSEDDRLVSTDVYTMYIYDETEEIDPWVTVDAEDFAETNFYDLISPLNYIVFDLNSEVAIGKSIRHIAVVEE